MPLQSDIYHISDYCQEDVIILFRRYTHSVHTQYRNDMESTIVSWL